MTHAHDLRQVGADHDDGVAVTRQLVEHVVDLALGTDVDPTRGLVEDEDLRLRREPFAEHDLLLGAA